MALKDSNKRTDGGKEKRKREKSKKENVKKSKREDERESNKDGSDEKKESMRLKKPKVLGGCARCSCYEWRLDEHSSGSDRRSRRQEKKLDVENFSQSSDEEDEVVEKKDCTKDVQYKKLILKTKDLQIVKIYDSPNVSDTVSPLEGYGGASQQITHLYPCKESYLLLDPQIQCSSLQPTISMHPNMLQMPPPNISIAPHLNIAQQRGALATQKPPQQVVGYPTMTYGPQIQPPPYPQSAIENQLQLENVHQAYMRKLAVNISQWPRQQDQYIPRANINPNSIPYRNTPNNFNPQSIPQSVDNSVAQICQQGVSNSVQGQRHQPRHINPADNVTQNTVFNNFQSQHTISIDTLNQNALYIQNGHYANHHPAANVQKTTVQSTGRAHHAHVAQNPAHAAQNPAHIAQNSSYAAQNLAHVSQNPALVVQNTAQKKAPVRRASGGAAQQTVQVVNDQLNISSRRNDNMPQTSAVNAAQSINQHEKPAPKINNVKSASGETVHPSEWIEDLDLAAQIYVAYNLIAPFERYKQDYLKSLTKKIRPIAISNHDEVMSSPNESIRSLLIDLTDEPALFLKPSRPVRRTTDKLILSQSLSATKATNNTSHQHDSLSLSSFLESAANKSIDKTSVKVTEPELFNVRETTLSKIDKQNHKNSYDLPDSLPLPVTQKIAEQQFDKPNKNFTNLSGSLSFSITPETVAHVIDKPLDKNSPSLSRSSSLSIIPKTVAHKLDKRTDKNSCSQLESMLFSVTPETVARKIDKTVDKNSSSLLKALLFPDAPETALHKLDKTIDKNSLDLLASPSFSVTTVTVAHKSDKTVDKNSSDLPGQLSLSLSPVVSHKADKSVDKIGADVSNHLTVSVVPNVLSKECRRDDQNSIAISPFPLSVASKSETLKGIRSIEQGSADLTAALSKAAVLKSNKSLKRNSDQLDYTTQSSSDTVERILNKFSSKNPHGHSDMIAQSIIPNIIISDRIDEVTDSNDILAQTVFPVTVVHSTNNNSLTLYSEKGQFNINASAVLNENIVLEPCGNGSKNVIVSLDGEVKPSNTDSKSPSSSLTTSINTKKRKSKSNDQTMSKKNKVVHSRFNDDKWGYLFNKDVYMDKLNDDKKVISEKSFIQNKEKKSKTKRKDNKIKTCSFPKSKNEDTDPKESTLDTTTNGNQNSEIITPDNYLVIHSAIIEATVKNALLKDDSMNISVKSPQDKSSITTPIKSTPPAYRSKTLVEIDMFEKRRKKMLKMKHMKHYYIRRYKLKSCFVKLERMPSSTLRKYLCQEDGVWYLNKYQESSAVESKYKLNDEESKCLLSTWQSDIKCENDKKLDVKDESIIKDEFGNVNNCSELEPSPTDQTLSDEKMTIIDESIDSKYRNVTNADDNLPVDSNQAGNTASSCGNERIICPTVVTNLQAQPEQKLRSTDQSSIRTESIFKRVPSKVLVKSVSVDAIDNDRGENIPDDKLRRNSCGYNFKDHNSSSSCNGLQLDKTHLEYNCGENNKIVITNSAEAETILRIEQNKSEHKDSSNDTMKEVSKNIFINIVSNKQVPAQINNSVIKAVPLQRKRDNIDASGHELIQVASSNDVNRSPMSPPGRSIHSLTHPRISYSPGADHIDFAGSVKESSTNSDIGRISHARSLVSSHTITINERRLSSVESSANGKDVMEVSSLLEPADRGTETPPTPRQNEETAQKTVEKFAHLDASEKHVTTICKPIVYPEQSTNLKLNSIEMDPRCRNLIYCGCESRHLKTGEFSNSFELSSRQTINFKMVSFDTYVCFKCKDIYTSYDDWKSHLCI